MNNRYYLRGFVASFVSFALQFFIIKIAQFYYNEIQLSLLFSIFTLGFASGTLLVLFDSKKRDLDFRWVAVSIMVFLFSLHFSTDRAVFYVLVFLLFLPIGHVIGSGISKVQTAHFYFSDLLGGATGVLYGFLATSYISIETSLVSFAAVAALISLSESFITGSRRVVSTGFLSICVLLFGVQVQRDVFNLLKWSKDISEPVVNSAEKFVNAYKFVKSGEAELMFSRWSLLDRVDILQSPTMGVTAYANNKLWTGVAGKDQIDNFPFLSKEGDFGSVLVVGYGGGEEFETAKRLGANRIVGVEVNSALVGILTKELKQRTAATFDGVELVTTDARFYLQSATKEFDLILNRFTDHRGKSARYLTHYNLIRTHDSIEVMLEKLTNRGIAVWTINGDGVFTDPTFTNIIIAAHRFLEKKQESEINRHFAIFVSHGPNKESLLGRTYNFVFSVQPISNEILKRYFNSTVELIYPPLNATFPISTFMHGLSAVQSDDDLRRYVLENNNGDYPAFSDDKPIGQNSASILMIFGNIVICFVVIAFLFGIAINKRESRGDGTIVRMAIALLTGFTYGLLEAALIQEVDYHTPAIALGYGIVLCMFLVSGGVASLVSSRWSTRTCFIAYLAAPIVSILWLSKGNIVALPWYAMGPIVFVYFIFISLIFPKLLEVQKRLSPSNLPYILAVNLVGLTMGTFVFCIYFIRFSRAEILYLVLSVTMAASLVVFRSYKASPIA